MEAQWRRLEAVAETTVFQSWDWCDCWLDHYGQGKQSVIIAATHEGRLAALAPLTRERSWYGFPVARLAFIGTGPGDYGGFLAAPDSGPGEDLLASALKDIRFDLLDLHQLPQAVAYRWREALRGRFNVALLEQEPTFVTALPDSFELFLASLSKKFRTNTVYADRRLRRDFRYERRSYENEGKTAAGMEVFFRLHQQRWLSKRLPGLFLGGRNRRFHQAVAARLASKGRLMLDAVFLDDKPAAALYGFKYQRRYSYYLGGFDPHLAKYSVSSVLIFNLIQEAIAQGALTFDFLRGREAYKRRWQARESPLYRLAAWPSTPSGRLAAWLARRHNYIVQRGRARLHS